MHRSDGRNRLEASNSRRRKVGSLMYDEDEDGMPNQGRKKQPRIQIVSDDDDQAAPATKRNDYNSPHRHKESSRSAQRSSSKLRDTEFSSPKYSKDSNNNRSTTNTSARSNNNSTRSSNNSSSRSKTLSHSYDRHNESDDSVEHGYDFQSPTSTSNPEPVPNLPVMSEMYPNNGDESMSTIVQPTDDAVSGTDSNDDGNIMVFQCKQCNNIVGDSTSWLQDDSNLNSFTLKKVPSSVKSSKKLITSSSKYDIGSTYEQLLCVGCSTVIGRVYKTTSSHLDALRHMPTIMAHAVKCYRLGEGKILSGANDGDWIVNVPSIKDLMFELEKTQTIVVALNNRLTALESDSAKTN